MLSRKLALGKPGAVYRRGNAPVREKEMASARVHRHGVLGDVNCETPQFQRFPVPSAALEVVLIRTQKGTTAW